MQYQIDMIVSRHTAAIEFIAAFLSTEGIEYRREGDALVARVRADVDVSFGAAGSQVGTPIPIIAQATADQVRHKFVAGNLPMRLAATAKAVWAIEFGGTPPRGAEYGLDDMLAAGAWLYRYVVRAARPNPIVPCEGHDHEFLAEDRGDRTYCRRCGASVWNPFLEPVTI